MNEEEVALRAVRALEHLRERAAGRAHPAREEIAIVGVGCRFPGSVSSPSELYSLLASGRDAVGTVPRSRWNAAAILDPDPDRPGHIYSTAGAFLEGIEDFDPEFFGISPREAPSVDPHQRLVLEVSYEALEDAGLRLDELRGGNTGVFIGMMPSEYGRTAVRDGDYSHVDGYFATGGDNSFAAGRLSYCMGFHGPSVTVNTACSSSLVAVHLAVQSLRAGECDVALAGGVSLVLSPELNVCLCRAGALSPSGRCSTFDDAANGFVRGEGCGMVALKRLSDAIADEDPLYAVIRGTATNHGGRSAGLTVPSTTAQRELVRSALRTSGTSVDEVSYVEAHGTGTALGDPVELKALSDAFLSRSAGRPFLVGSLKTHIGHLDAAAGIAGLIKVCALFGEELIPPPLHQSTPNRNFDWERAPFRVNREPEPWPGQKVAGVSAFGLSGTNAHVVLAQHPRGSVPRVGAAS